MKQGLQCRDCKTNVHKKCAKDLALNCQIGEGGMFNSSEPMMIDSEPSTPSSASDLSSAIEDSMIPLSRLPGAYFTLTRTNINSVDVKVPLDSTKKSYS